MAASVGNVVFEISAKIGDLQSTLKNVENQFQSTFNKVTSISGGLNIRALENTFQTSFRNIGQAGIESFASIQAAGATFYAAQAAQQARLTKFSSLGAANISTGPAATAKSDAVELVRFEAVRQQALTASRKAFKDFEDGIRGGNKNIAASMAQGAAASTGLGSSMGGLLGVAKQLFPILSVGFAIGFIRSSIQAIGALQDLSDATGIAADTLLSLRPVLENSGSSVESFARGINLMQKEIIAGTPETVANMAKLGISIQEMLATADDPEGFINKLAAGLAKIGNQAERVAVAKQILGKAGAENLPALLQVAAAGGTQGLPKPIISREDIAAIDAAGDAMNTLKINTQAFVAVSFVGILSGLGKMVDFVAFIVDKLDRASRLLPNFSPSKQEIADIIARNKAASESGPSDAAAFQASEQSNAFRTFPAPNKSGPVDISKGTFFDPAQLAKQAAAPEFTDTQKAFNKSLDEQILSLKSQVVALTQSKEAAIDNTIAIEKAKAATIGLDGSSAALNKRLEEFRAISIQLQQAQLADSLTKGNHALEVQVALATQGQDASEALALKYLLEDSHLKTLNKEIIDAIANQKALNQAKQEAPVAQAKLEFDQERLSNQAKARILGGNFGPNFNQGQADLDALNRRLETIFKQAGSQNAGARKIALKALIEIQPEIDQANLKAIRDTIGIDLAKDIGFAKIQNQTFANSFDEAAAKVDRLTTALQSAKAQGLDPMSDGVKKIAADLDQAKIDEAFANIARDTAIAATQADLFGKSFDLGAAKVQAIQSQLANLTTQGISAKNPAAQKIAGDLNQAKISDISTNLAKAREEGERLGQALGGAFDTVSDNISKTTQAIQDLIHQGLDPADSRITQLQAQLMDLRAIDAFKTGLEGLGYVAAQALTGQIKSWKDLGSAVARVFDQIAADWLRMQAKMIINNMISGASGGNAGGAVSEAGSAFSGIASFGGSILKAFGFHDGGMAGINSTFTRNVSPALFTYAPRYHQGIDFAGGEMPAILKRGEEVGWPDKLAAKYGGGGPTVIHIHQPQFQDRRSMQQVLAKLSASVDQGKRNR